MAASGIKVNDYAKEILLQMKVHSAKEDASERIRVVTLTITDEIKVDEIFRQKDLCDKGNVYAFVRNLMREKECKYIVYDCHYETTVCNKEELVFIMWSSDNASMKLKLPYASSKAYLKKCMNAKHEFEFHGMDENSPCAFTKCIKKMAKCEIRSLEGEGVVDED